MIFAQGRYWKDVRRFVLKSLRDFGFGKSSQEELIQEEMAKLCAVLSKNANQPMDLGQLFNVSILNNLWEILVGERFDLDDPRLYEAVEKVTRLVSGGTPVSPIAGLLPHRSMLKWPGLRKIAKIDLALDTMENVLKIIEPYYEPHRRSLDPENPRDLMDLFIMEINKAEADPTSPFHGKRGYSTIVNTMIDLFIAGMDTTASSLCWTILFLLHHPEVQKQIHKELDEVF